MDSQNERSTSRTLPSYEIREPVGYALLLGCGGSHGPVDQERPSHRQTILEDIGMMEGTLNNLGWAVFSPCLEGRECVEFTAESCEQIVNNLESPELSRFSCFLLYYSGRGTAGGIVASNGRVVPFKDIVTKIATLNAIAGKPKIFIFNCCRQVSQKELINLQNQSLSYSRELEDHLHQDGSTEGYPPPDCVLCFSACEGYTGYGQKGSGSYYTTVLCKSLTQFGRLLPFVEIMTQVSGGTVNVSDRVFGLRQQPVFKSTLNKCLTLRPTGMRLPSRRPQVVSEDSPTVTLPLSSGPSSLGGSDTTSMNDVVSDNVVVAGPRKVFKSREDVEKNLAKLGQGVSVFVVYAPDPESPYYDPRTREQEIGVNERRIFQLVYDLECLGFHVITDLHLGDNTPANWLEWYTARVELCDYVLLVGSPAFCELFSREKPRGEILDRRAKLLLSYKNAVYAEIIKEVSTKPGASKFVPILLDPRWPIENAIPFLFGAATVYQLLEGEHRRFVYDNRYRDFEKLVCRLSGINRAEFDKVTVMGVQRLPPPHQGGVSVAPIPTPLEALGRPRTGYKVVMPTLLPTSSSIRAVPPPTAVGHPHVYPVSQPHPAFLAGPPAPPVQVGQQQWYHGQPRGSAPQQSLYHPQPAAGMVNPSAFGGSHYGVPHAQPQQQQPLSPPSVPPPTSLPDLEPPDRTDLFLWLSKSLVGWPFVARYLGFNDEATIERIKEENPHDVSEQCYLMLDRWYRERPSRFSCQTLGEALFRSERNKHLYPEFVQRVMAQLRSQDMDTN